MKPTTFTRDGITISLYLNTDNSVNCSKMMSIGFEIGGKPVAKQAYPDSNPATVNTQFEYAKSIKSFEETYLSVGGDTEKVFTTD